MQRPAARTNRFFARLALAALLPPLALALAIGAGCEARMERESKHVDDRSTRARLEDEFAGCPPLAGINPAAGSWEPGTATRYRATQLGDVVIVRATGQEDVSYDLILALAPVTAPAAVAPAAGGAAAAKPPPASGGLVRPVAPDISVVYFYRRPPATKLAGLKDSFEICGHFRTTKTVEAVIVRDANGEQRVMVEQGR